MDPTEFDELLSRTLDDRRLSRGEKQALRQVFADADLDRHAEEFRRRAFEIARGALSDPQADAVLGWLADVLGLLRRQERDDDVPDLAEAYFSPADDGARRIVGLIGSARRTLDVCVFTITDDRIADAILDAQRRGVRVRVVTDDDKAGDLGSDVDRLEHAGVAVRLDRTEYHMHHKFALFDGGTLLTGSYNWTRGASANNEENFIVTTDPRLVGPFARTFEALWKRLG